MKVLIDGDFIPYALGFVMQQDGIIESKIDKVHKTVDLHLNNIVKLVNASSKIIFLSGKNNFRTKLYPDYKISRKDVEKPYHYKNIREYLIMAHQARVVNGMEADDALGIEQMKYHDADQYWCDNHTIIFSKDKDLDMIPGWHYSSAKRGIYWINELESMRNFYKQMITGDRTDDIPGLSEKKPKKRTYKTLPLDKTADLSEMKEYVMEGYIEKFGSSWQNEYELNYSLLWILREEELEV